MSELIVGKQGYGKNYNTKKVIMNTKTKAPRGVNGKQRELFLSLTPQQQETYLYHFTVIGRPAALAYRYATEGQ